MVSAMCFFLLVCEGDGNAYQGVDFIEMTGGCEKWGVGWLDFLVRLFIERWIP